MTNGTDILGLKLCCSACKKTQHQSQTWQLRTVLLFFIYVRQHLSNCHIFVNDSTCVLLHHHLQRISNSCQTTKLLGFVSFFI